MSTLGKHRMAHPEAISVAIRRHGIPLTPAGVRVLRAAAGILSGVHLAA